MKISLLLPILMLGIIVGVYGDFESLDCYDCTYSEERPNDGDRNCLDNPEKTKVFSCQSPDRPHCIKISAGVNGNRTVTRFCHYMEEKTTGCLKDGKLVGFTGNICYCDTDKCNGGGANAFNVVLTASMPLAMSIIYARHWNSLDFN